MQNPILDLLSTSLVPELGADVAAGTAGDVHLGLVGVAALRADPDELAVRVFLDLDLAVEAADLTVIRLRVEFGVHDVVIDELHDLQHGVEVLLHIRDLDIADRAAGGERLELRLKGQLIKGVDMLGHMDVIGICDIVLIRDARNDAEALLQALGEFIRRGFQRRAVEREIDVRLGLPLGARVVEVVHDIECERRGGRVGVGLAGHVLDALIKSRVAEGNCRISAVEQLLSLIHI